MFHEICLGGSHSLEAHLKVFKSKDVQDANRLEVILASDPAVDLLDHPLEAACVKCHGQGVPAIYCLRERRQRCGFPNDRREPRWARPSLLHLGATLTPHLCSPCQVNQYHTGKHGCLKKWKPEACLFAARVTLKHQAFKFSFKY